MDFRHIFHLNNKVFKALHINIHKSLLLAFFISITVFFAYSQKTAMYNNTSKNSNTYDSITTNDTVKKNLSDFSTVNDSLISDSINNPLDSIQNDSLKPKPKGSIESIINHKADDYVKENFSTKTTELHNNAEIEYTTTKINAGHIEINHESNVIIARGIKDSTGVYTQRPIVIQDGQESIHDSIRMNYKSEKLIAFGSDAEVGGLYTNTNKMKKVNDSTIYIRDVIVTTSDKPIPDYHILISKGKMVPNQKIIAGASQFYIAEVPTPLILPFAYFPLTEGKASGIIVPSYGQSNQQGYFLQNGGYYIAASDYFDAAITGDLYTNGSWALGVQSQYKLRYKYSGNFNFRYESLINGLRGDTDYSINTNYNIKWNHRQDAQSNPNARFSARVNFGSSKYFKQSLNEYNSNAFLNNQFNSSISYQKTFVGTPFNLTSSITHTQNTNTEKITMSLPSVQLSMNRIYPFAPSSGTKKNAIHNLGLTYNMSADYKINTVEENFLTSDMFNKDGSAGMKQDAGLSTNMKVLKHFTLSPNARYKEVWYLESIDKNYDATNNEVVTDTISGFSSFREYSAGASLATTLYGDFAFKKGRLQAIRHTMRPSVSYNYVPDFSHYYAQTQASSDPDDILEYSTITGIYGGPSKGTANNIGMSLNNNFEAKMKSKDSTDSEFKKIKLLNNLNLSSAYNITADSLKWSPVAMSAGTAIFKQKMNINARATLDPYAIDVNGKKMDVFNINNGGSLFRLTNASLNLNYALNNESFKRGGKLDDDFKKNQGTNRNDPTNSDGIFGEDMSVTNARDRDTNKKEVKTSKLYAAKLPWTMRLAYTLNYNNTSRQNEITSQSIMFTGDVELSPKWKVGFNSGFDLKEKGFTYTQLRFNRDLDSWKMSFNWVPFGPRATYNFYIGIKSSILSDVKYDQRKAPDKSF